MGIPASKHLCKAGNVAGGKFPAPSASITTPFAWLSQIASSNSPSIPAYAFNKYTPV